jgi:hypothetical protein
MLDDMITLLLGLAGMLLLAAGVTMALRGVVGRRSVMNELADQRICFPAGEALPDGLTRFAGVRVRTGEQARAYSDLIAAHVTQATGGRTYAELADEWLAGGRKDEGLAKLRETAFMGQTLRGALLGAYQAWQITVLVAGLGILFTAIGAVLLAVALQR